MDLANFDSIRSFVTAFKQIHDSLDVLCNNAGMTE
jgi:short-subunit dehydrogenase involved in D-alanine esterification of teichoic acids